MRNALILGLIVAGAATIAVCARPPETVSGIAKVIDGDSLEIGAARIRLFGIDAPEGRQVCTRDSAPWPCGTAAAHKLRDLIDSEAIDCVQRDIDQYKRIVAVCKKGPTDLGASMVKAGLALAYRQYSNDYVDEEDDARRAKRGLWGSEFTAPWDYRHSPPNSRERAHPDPAPPPQGNSPPHAGPLPESSAECMIKGNINMRGERIYHLPGTSGYDKTVIDPDRGEGWFCSEDGAKDAGWRAPRGNH